MTAQQDPLAALLLLPVLLLLSLKVSQAQQ
jgi:hypothetical protein